MKISIIGAGNVGATLAKRIIEGHIADVVLLDVVKGLAQGKALDLLHASPIMGCQNSVLGTDDYRDTKGSDIVVITAGFPRKRGMSRADLAKKNGAIIKEVVKNIKETSPGSIIIVVTNPLDAMTYLAYRESSFKRERVIGMAGILDSSRFVYIIAKRLDVNYRNVETIVLGQHGPGMVPIISHTKVSGKKIIDLTSKEEIGELIKELRECGAKIVNLLGKGSAYYAPSAASLSMIKMIKNDEKSLTAVSCLAKGEYGLSNLCTGLPVKLGKNGIEEIVKLDLNKEEMEGLKSSAKAANELISKL